MTAPDPLIADLRDRRIAAGLSQTALAAAIGCAKSVVSEVESGHRGNPTLATLRRFGQALGVQPGWLPLAYETAPVERCTPAGNGAAEGGLKSPPDAPASDPAPLQSVAGSDVAPKSPADAAATSGVLGDGGCASSAVPTADVALTSTPGIRTYEGYVDLSDVPPTLNPNAVRDAYGLGPDPSVARTVGGADVAHANPCPWCDCGFWAEPHPCGRASDPAVARTLDVAERTVEKARKAPVSGAEVALDEAVEMGELRARVLDYAKMLVRFAETPPAADVAWKLRQIAEVHKPFDTDGVTYCGWDGHDGCGHVWPCPTIRRRTALPT